MNSKPNKMFPVQHKQIIRSYSPMILSSPIRKLPDELLAEILVRLPVKYILRCRCVQKSWYYLVRTPMFVTSHLNYQKKFTSHDQNHPKYLFFRNTKTNALTIRFDDAQCEVYCAIRHFPHLQHNTWYAVSYGLICTSAIPSYGRESNLDRNIYLWNPLIRKYKTLPDSPLPSRLQISFDILQDWEALAFGFVPEINDYVVVHFVKCRLRRNYKIERSLMVCVYNLSTNSWKRPKQDIVFKCHLWSTADVVFVDGAAFLLGINSYFNQIVLCFDTKTETLREYLLPEWIESFANSVIHSLGQSVTYFVKNNKFNCLNMWVLRGDRMKGFYWEKKMSVSPSKNVQHAVMGLRNNGEPILFSSKDFISYNLDSHEAKDLVVSWNRWDDYSCFSNGFRPPFLIPFSVTPFVESLALLDI